MSGVKIKICGLTRYSDAEYVNLAMPDYAGFVFCDKSRRNIAFEQAKELRQALHPAIQTVGVFVNESMEQIASLYSEGVITIIQLHGGEDDAYIARLRVLAPDAEIWKAFPIRSEKDVRDAEECAADMVLLDSGGGTGRRFDWPLIKGFPRLFVLAGGLTPENIAEAVSRFHPYAVDVSTGVETDGYKDCQKIMAAVLAARGR